MCGIALSSSVMSLRALSDTFDPAQLHLPAAPRTRDAARRAALGFGPVWLARTGAIASLVVLVMSLPVAAHWGGGNFGPFGPFAPIDPAGPFIKAMAAIIVGLLGGAGCVVAWLLQRAHRDLGAAQKASSDNTDELARLQTLWQALPAGAVVHAHDGRIIDANPMAETLLSLSRDQLLGLSPMDSRWIALDAKGQPLAGVDHPAMRTLRTGEPCHNQIMGIALPDGSRRWLRVQSWPVKHLPGSSMAVVASFVDVTEGRAQRRLLDLTIDAAGLGTWDLTLSTGEAQYNSRWFEMLGFKSD